MPASGFVVAQNDVKKFFNDKLSYIGLNEKEISDFMEFWYPKFNTAPYYFVTLMTNEDFDKIAPLEIDPNPDTVIRVYMDYLPLLKPIKISEPYLPQTTRSGFTVVEWGGALHK